MPIQTPSLDETLKEWQSKRRRMGCVAATDWFCRRQPEFYPLRRRFYLPSGSDRNGEFWEHVVATNGIIEIDLAPYANRPNSDVPAA